MQNIPSHATDIRHMFRATPEQKENINIKTNENNTATFTLSLYDSVPTPNGITKVNKLQENDIIVMKNGTENVNMTIASITSEKDKATIIVERRE